MTTDANMRRNQAKMYGVGQVVGALLLTLILTFAASAAESSRTPVVVWIYGYQNDIVEWARGFEERFNRDNPDIEVTIDVGAGLRREEIVVATATGLGPDIHADSMNVLGMYYLNGLTLPIDQYLEKMSDASELHPQLLENVRIGGETHALPLFIVPELNSYNLEMIWQAGLEEPSTWDEMVEVARRMTKPGSGGLEKVGFWLHENAAVVASRLLTATAQLEEGGFFTVNDREVRLNNDVGRRAMRYLMDLYQAGRNEWSRDGLESFIAGDVGVYNMFTDRVMASVDEIPFELGFFPYVGPEVGADILEYNGDGLMLTPNSKHPDKAWRVMEALTRPENLEGFLSARAYALPVRSSMLSDEELMASSIPQSERIIELFQTARLGLYPSANPFWTDIRTVIGTDLVRALKGEIAPEVALELAEPVANAVLRDASR